MHLLYFTYYDRLVEVASMTREEARSSYFGAADSSAGDELPKLSNDGVS